MAMASDLLAMALQRAMASTLVIRGGLHPNSDGLHLVAMASTLII